MLTPALLVAIGMDLLASASKPKSTLSQALGQNLNFGLSLKHVASFNITMVHLSQCKQPITRKKLPSIEVN